MEHGYKLVRIITVHNHYQQPGGEDKVFAAEADLLEAHGHSVTRYELHNDSVSGMGYFALAKSTIWNGDQYRKLRNLFESVQPDIVHVHNTLPLVSPAVYSAAQAEGAVVVQTLHNYRLSCVNGLFFRDGHVCEECRGRLAPWLGVLRGCYRHSRAASAAVAAMVGYHRAIGTYREQVNTYIALTSFARQVFVSVGLPDQRLVVKPNFVYPDSGVGAGLGGYALFVGRLSEEKGLGTLLAAWRRVGARLPLRIVGDGPLATRVATVADGVWVRWLGRQEREQVLALMRDATVLVFPSIWYEGFPITLVEAAASGTPVVASDIGGIAEIVEHRRTGILFRPGDAQALADAVGWASSHPSEITAMRRAARARYEAKYTAEVNYRELIAIYQRALGVGGQKRSARK